MADRSLWEKEANLVRSAMVDWTPDRIFVFGSNLAGRHGAGAAKFARERCGAIYGQGVGMQGKSYGIPTKDSQIQTLPLSQISGYIHDFLKYVFHSKKSFYVTRIGCGLAGYSDSDIAPLFVKAHKDLNIKPNQMDCIYDPAWESYGLPTIRKV